MVSKMFKGSFLRRCLAALLMLAVFATVLCVPTTVKADSKPAKVTGLEVTRKDKSTLVVSWGETVGAQKYEVWMKTNKGAFKKMATTKKYQYTVKKLKLNSSYTFRIRAVAKSGKKTLKGEYSDKIKTKLTEWVYLTSIMKPYQREGSTYKYVTNPEFVTMGGKEYYNGIIFDGRKSVLYFNLDGQFKKITMTVGSQDGKGYNSDFPAGFIFYADGEEIKNVSRQLSDLPGEVSLDIADVVKLTIESYTSGKVYDFTSWLNALMDIKLYY